MKLQNIKLGFTLIELLVVITIIGILATGAVSIYTSQIQKARDTTRVTDIKALQAGVEQFYQDKYVYPLGGDFVGSGGVQAYVPQLAQDPKHDETCINSQCGYAYAVNDDSNGISQGAYEISTAFENKGNMDNKADNNTDNGDDVARLELGVPTSATLDSSVAKDSDLSTAVETDVANTDTQIVIKGGGIITKP